MYPSMYTTLALLSVMNDILHLVTVYEVLIYCQTIQGVGGYWKEEEDIGEYATVYSPVI